MSRQPSSLSGIWHGYLSGSNRGRIVVQIHQSGNLLEADAVFLDYQFGPVIIMLRGTIEGKEAKFRLLRFRGFAPVLPLDGQLAVNFDDSVSGASGTWLTDIGTNGICKLERTSEMRVRWWYRLARIKQAWFFRRWRTTAYSLLLLGVAAAALVQYAQLTVQTLILLLIPAPFLFSHHIAGLVATFYRARIRKIGPVEFDQNPPTAEIVAIATQQAQENVAFAQLNQFFVLRTKILIAAVAHGNGMTLAEFGQMARSFGIAAENVETTLIAILQMGCAHTLDGKLIPTEWGKAFVRKGLILA